MRNFKKGFTLIEVLIVVAIIAILASVILVGLGPTSRAGRDARRIADLSQVRSGLELYFRLCGYYPGGAHPDRADCGTNNDAGQAGAPDYAGMMGALTGSPIGVTQVPDDPQAPAKAYLYGSTDGTSYTLGATLEDANEPSLSQDVDDPASNGLDCTDPVYCVTL